MVKIGVMGGTFDPIHYGHIRLAEAARDQLALSQVFIIPAKLQPFKLDKKLTEGRHRLNMIQLAVQGRPQLVPCNYELQQEEISYTINTLRAVRKKYGEEAEIFFLIGTDAFLKMGIWKDAEELLGQYTIAVGTRPGYKEEEVAGCIDKYMTEYNSHICRVSNPQVDVSSTEIRERIRCGQSLKDLMPEAIERYIKENGLYN